MEEPLIRASNIILLDSDIAEKRKYCLVMEDYKESQDNYIVFYLTSKVEKYGSYKWCVVVSAGTGNLPKESVINPDNYFDLKLDELKRARLIGRLPEKEWKRVHDAMCYARHLPFDLLIRTRDYEFYK